MKEKFERLNKLTETYQARMKIAEEDLKKEFKAKIEYMKENIFRKIKISSLQLILLGIGIIFLITGIFLGNPLDIFRKAIFICMECIGIG